jgi:hypothetical protein
MEMPRRYTMSIYINPRPVLWATDSELAKALSHYFNKAIICSPGVSENYNEFDFFEIYKDSERIVTFK